MNRFRTFIELDNSVITTGYTRSPGIARTGPSPDHPRSEEGGAAPAGGEE